MGFHRVPQRTCYVLQREPICPYSIQYVGGEGPTGVADKTEHENDTAHASVGSTDGTQEPPETPEGGDDVDGGTDRGALRGVDKTNLPVHPLPTQLEEAAEETRPEVSQAVELIKKWEGFAPRAYWDYRQWSIGYGTPSDKGESISRAEAREELIDVVESIHKFVYRDLADSCSVKRVAVISFIYNVGIGNYKRSTFRKHIREGNYEKAASEMLRWNKAGGRVLEGLKRRRAAEAKLVRSGCESDSSRE